MTVKEFDVICFDYVSRMIAVEDAKIKADEAKAVVMTAVQQHGSVPKNAEASRRMEGANWCATVTTGTTVDVNDAACTELEIVLSRAKQHDIFANLFSRRTEFSLVKGAESALKQAKLPARWRDRIHQLYASCFSVHSKSPSLKVEAIAVVRDREDKASKKATKTAKSTK